MKAFSVFFFSAHIDQFSFLKRFGETEGIAALTMLVSQFKINVKDEPQFAGETFEQRKTRLLKCWNWATLTWVFDFLTI